MNKEVIEISDDDSCPISISRLAPVPMAIPLIGLEIQDINSCNKNVAVGEKNVNSPVTTPIYVEIEAHVVNEEPYLISSAESSSENDEDKYPAIKKRKCVNSLITNNTYCANDNLLRKTNKPGPLSKTRYLSKSVMNKQSTSQVHQLALSSNKDISIYSNRLSSDDESSEDDNSKDEESVVYDLQDEDSKDYLQEEDSEDDYIEDDDSEDEESIVDLITDSEDDNKSNNNQSENCSCKVESHEVKYCINDLASSFSLKDMDKRVNLTTLSQLSQNRQDSSGVELLFAKENSTDAINSKHIDRGSNVDRSPSNSSIDQKDSTCDEMLPTEKKESNYACSKNIDTMFNLDRSSPTLNIVQKDSICDEVLPTEKKESNDVYSKNIETVFNVNRSSPTSIIDQKDSTCDEVFPTEQKEFDDTYSENIDRVSDVNRSAPNYTIDKKDSTCDEVLSTEKNESNDTCSGVLSRNIELMSGIDTILPHSAINQNYSSYSEISTGNKDSDVTGLSMLPEDVEKMAVVGSPNLKINQNDSSEKKDPIDAGSKNEVEIQTVSTIPDYLSLNEKKFSNIAQLSAEKKDSDDVDII